jgi:all-trans-8'-apo-beta-carotenal 15,15'-oxygenase
MWTVKRDFVFLLLVAMASREKEVDAFSVHSSVVKMKSTASTITTSASASSTTDEVILSRSGHDPKAWKNGYRTATVEIPPTLIDIPNLPADFPSGTYYRNGHACFESPDGIRCRHMFDGDGMVIGATFYPETKQLLFRNRFVRTDGYVKDKAEKIMSRPGVFGTKVSGGFFKNLFRLDFKNVANTHVLYRNDKLYALWEAGWPYVLDPLTLENDVEKEPAGHNLNGLLEKGQNFAAHYRYCSHTGNIVNFGVQLDPSSGDTRVDLWEFDNDMKSVRSDDVSFVFKGAGVIHDFCITENWHVFVMPPATVDQKKAVMGLLGQAAFADVIGFDREATESTVYLIPRLKDLKVGSAAGMRAGEDERVKVIKVPYHFNFHFANGFEDEDGYVVIDSVLVDSVDLGTELDPTVPVWEAADLDEFSPGRYDRLTVDPSTCKALKMETISRREPEFPSIPKVLSGKRHRYTYTVGAHKDYEPLPNGKGKGANGSILKIDTEDPSKSEAYAFLPHEFVGEQVFCPKVGADVSQPGSEDRGYLVTYIENRRDLTTDMVIFDVEGKGSLEKGPVCQLAMPTWIPPGLHGSFVEGLSFDLSRI